LIKYEKYCISFCRTGLPVFGMGKDLIGSFPQLKSIYDTASDIVGFDVFEKCCSGSEEELAQTIVSQPAIMATSIVAYDAAVLSGIDISASQGILLVNMLLWWLRVFFLLRTASRL
jgi:[acyl-carrier-protein] S-malonyltransferase